MNRSSGKPQPRSSGCKIPLLAAGLAMLLSACGEGPGDPKPPLSPPRPITEVGHISDAHMKKMPARAEAWRA